MENKRKRIKEEDFISALRLTKKLLPLLQRKGKNAVVTYLALKILMFDLEADFGLSLTKEDEQELKAYIKTLDGENLEE
jgi:hypothetical protein